MLVLLGVVLMFLLLVLMLVMFVLVVLMVLMFVVYVLVVLVLVVLLVVSLWSHYVHVPAGVQVDNPCMVLDRENFKLLQGDEKDMYAFFLNATYRDRVLDVRKISQPLHPCRDLP